MIPLSTSVIAGLLVCLPFSLFVYVTFSRWPRLWLHSLPPDIVALARPKTATEEQRTRLLMIPILVILPGLSFVSALVAARWWDLGLSFVGAAIHIYVVWLVVHVWDFVVIDCGYALLMDPDRPPIPGTAGAKGYQDYAFHFRALVRAAAMSVIPVPPLAWLASVIA